MNIIKVKPSVIKPLIVKNHYLHRMPTGIYVAYALVVENEIKGVAIFSKSYNTHMVNGIAGKTYKNQILEFSRMWVSDDMPYNTESKFISKCLRLLKNKIIISFADPQVGHVGYIYQATNWVYLGKGKDRLLLVPKNHEGHPLTVVYNITAKKLTELYGIENLKTVLLSGKHKYIYVTLKGKKRLEFFKRMRHVALPYPKQL